MILVIYCWVTYGTVAVSHVSPGKNSAGDRVSALGGPTELNLAGAAGTGGFLAPAAGLS